MIQMKKLNDCLKTYYQNLLPGTETVEGPKSTFKSYNTG